MRRAALALALALGAPIAAGGCFQALDTGAAAGSPGADQPAFGTPAIPLPDGGVASAACELTAAQAHQILVTYCGGCHDGSSPGARQGQPPFDYVLDVDKLIAARSATVPDPIEPDQGMRFLRPGDPDDSRVYRRVVAGEMPPELPVGVDPLPRPTTSDASVLQAWIAGCL